jgi:hypothetical protein
MGYVSGARWVAWSTALVVGGVGALVLADYALDMSRARPAVATPVTAAHLIAEGDRRLAARDYAAALQHYDEAMMLDATHLGAFYRAGVALSYLGEREQTTTLFLWVVRHGPAEREEVRRAREWLQAAKALPRAAP